jgi:hypothetical protein
MGQPLYILLKQGRQPEMLHMRDGLLCLITRIFGKKRH